MAWLRVDDGFTKHPKFERWTPAQRWAWLEVMEYCARYRTAGRVPNDLTLLPRSTTPTLLQRAEKSGWCERLDDGYLWINDWETYNPSRSEALEEAVESALRNHPGASANDVHRQVGGNRKQVLELVRQYQAGTDNGTREPVPELVTRARSRPVPSFKEPQAVALDADDEEADRTARDQLLAEITPDFEEVG